MKKYYVRMDVIREVSIELEADSEAEARIAAYDLFMSLEGGAEFNQSDSCVDVDSIEAEEL